MRAGGLPLRGIPLGMVGTMELEQLWSEVGLSHRPDGVLWDMDGTLIDTEPEWLAASIDVVEESGGIWLADEDPQAILGVSSEDHATALARAVTRGTGRPADPWPLFHRVVAAVERHMRDGFTLMPGALELMSAFAGADIPQALVTASPRVLVDALFDGIDGHPLRTAVTGDDDIPGKPHPAPYLLGAERLGVPIQRCLGFEDSVTGLAAARGAGAVTVSVTERPLATLLPLLEVRS